LAEGLDFLFFIAKLFLAQRKEDKIKNVLEKATDGSCSRTSGSKAKEDIALRQLWRRIRK